jgi:diphthine-ammonia ligase
MKFVALVSGGKDSIYSIQECIRNGHDLVCCIHLGAPLSVEEESFMYQTAGSNVLSVLVEDCLDVPLILQRRKGKSVNISMVYENDDAEDDEVEDLYVALKTALEQFPEIQAVSSGAILSNYQRIRVEHVCNRLKN